MKAAGSNPDRRYQRGCGISNKNMFPVVERMGTRAENKSRDGVESVPEVDITPGERRIDPLGLRIPPEERGGLHV